MYCQFSPLHCLETSLRLIVSRIYTRYEPSVHTPTLSPPSLTLHMYKPNLLQLLPYHPTNFNSFHTIAAGTLCTACVDRCLTCLSAPARFLLECPLLCLKASVHFLPIRTPYTFPITTPPTSILTTPSQLVPRPALFPDIHYCEWMYTIVSLQNTLRQGLKKDPLRLPHHHPTNYSFTTCTQFHTVTTGTQSCSLSWSSMDTNWHWNLFIS